MVKRSYHIGLMTVSFVCLSVVIQTKNVTEINDQRGCNPKFQMIFNHTACIKPSSKVLKSGVSERDKQVILSVHNAIRGNVKPSAKDMTKLIWDKEIAMLAQNWANQCPVNYDQYYERFIPDRFFLGQNLAVGYNNWNETVSVWEDDSKNYKYGAAITNEARQYTQIIWAHTYAIGCGYAECSDALKKYYICNYGPAGNVGHTATPYKKGPYAEDCAKKDRSGRLCECNKVCESSTVLNLKDCTCECNHNLYQMRELCKVNCTLAVKYEEYNFCEGKIQPNRSICYTSQRIPFRCPVSCRYCPGSSDQKTGPPDQITGTFLGYNQTFNISAEQAVSRGKAFVPSILFVIVSILMLH